MKPVLVIYKSIIVLSSQSDISGILLDIFEELLPSTASLNDISLTCMCNCS